MEARNAEGGGGERRYDEKMLCNKLTNQTAFTPAQKCGNDGR